MSRYAVFIAALALTLSACGSETPAAQPQPAPPPTTTPPPTTSAPPTTTTTPSAPPTNTNPPAPPSSNVKDCFDGDCTLLLTKPIKIALDGKKLPYSSIRVSAVSAESITINTSSPGGGSSKMSFGLDGGGRMGRTGSGQPFLETKMILVDGKPALVLQLGPPQN